MDAKEKRKRVMQRSIKLGHCVCDPRKPCPCPLFKEKNVCTCAGERVPVDSDTNDVRLTDFVRSAGCASKIGQGDLHKVLDMLPEVTDPRLVVGTATADDAGVFELTPEVTVVQTVDVFTPGVDDPFLFGRIAACNSLSDVYAMGGKPVTALSVIGFPIYSLPHDVMAEIIKGGMEVLKEADTILLGGHSINDEEVKFGFAVTGVIAKEDLITNAGAKPGDMLVLTKPVGTGIVSLAGQINKASDESKEAVTNSMATLNRTAAELMVKHGANACTDVTGFGLLGHLCHIVMESKVTAEVWYENIPLFPGVAEYAEKGMFSGANERNAEFTESVTSFSNDISEDRKAVLYDAQTSGGLLIAVPGENAQAMVAEMHEAGVEYAAVIGEITAASQGQINVVSNAEDAVIAEQPAAEKKVVISEDRNGDKDMSDNKEEEGCCSHGGSSSGSAMDKFSEFIDAAMTPGNIDIVAKELISVALSLAVGCVPCSRTHIKKALNMGMTADELEEAAALAAVFGGCKAMMLWYDMKKELL